MGNIYKNISSSESKIVQILKPGIPLDLTILADGFNIHTLHDLILAYIGRVSKNAEAATDRKIFVTILQTQTDGLVKEIVHRVKLNGLGNVRILESLVKRTNGKPWKKTDFENSLKQASKIVKRNRKKYRKEKTTAFLTVFTKNYDINFQYKKLPKTINKIKKSKIDVEIEPYLYKALRGFENAKPRSWEKIVEDIGHLISDVSKKELTKLIGSGKRHLFQLAVSQELNPKAGSIKLSNAVAERYANRYPRFPFLNSVNCADAKDHKCEELIFSPYLYLAKLKEIGTNEAQRTFVKRAVKDYRPKIFRDKPFSPDFNQSDKVRLWKKRNEIDLGRFTDPKERLSGKNPQLLPALDNLFRYGKIKEINAIDALIDPENTEIAYHFLIRTHTEWGEKGKKKRSDHFVVHPRGIDKFLANLTHDETARLIKRIEEVAEKDVGAAMIWCRIFSYIPEVKEAIDQGDTIWGKMPALKGRLIKKIYNKALNMAFSGNYTISDPESELHFMLMALYLSRYGELFPYLHRENLIQTFMVHNRFPLKFLDVVEDISPSFVSSVEIIKNLINYIDKRPSLFFVVLRMLESISDNEIKYYYLNEIVEKTRDKEKLLNLQILAEAHREAEMIGMSTEPKLINRSISAIENLLKIVLTNIDNEACITGAIEGYHNKEFHDFIAELYGKTHIPATEYLYYLFRETFNKMTSPQKEWAILWGFAIQNDRDRIDIPPIKMRSMDGNYTDAARLLKSLKLTHEEYERVLSSVAGYSRTSYIYSSGNSRQLGGDFGISKEVSEKISSEFLRCRLVCWRRADKINPGIAEILFTKFSEEHFDWYIRFCLEEIEKKYTGGDNHSIFEHFIDTIDRIRKEGYREKFMDTPQTIEKIIVMLRSVLINLSHKPSRWNKYKLHFEHYERRKALYRLIGFKKDFENGLLKCGKENYDWIVEILKSQYEKETDPVIKEIIGHAITP